MSIKLDSRQARRAVEALPGGAAVLCFSASLARR